MVTNFRYTVLMSVYNRVDADELIIAIDSMLAQTLPPAEIVIVKDGPLTSRLDKLLSNYRENSPSLFKFVPLEENVGLGSAYKAGTEYCTCDYIAIMDCDDYSVPERCEKEAEYFISHPETDIVGSSVVEFSGNIDNRISFRKMPQSHDECVKFAHSRCPCAHPSTMLKKSALLKAGGYKKCLYAEDYHLYVRMIMNGCIFYNFPDTFVYTRVSDKFYGRRGGMKYLGHILSCKTEFYKMGFYSFFDLIKCTVIHTAVCLVPNPLRNYIYKIFLRKSP